MSGSATAVALGIAETAGGPAPAALAGFDGTSPIIGIRPETKELETRVGLTPVEVRALVEMGCQVLVPAEAGIKSGYADDAYRLVGATIVRSREEVFRQARVLVGVKEPQPWEFEHFQPGQIYCSYLHLGGAPELLRALQEKGVTAVAYELIQEADGTLPVLAPMSEVAGALAVYKGADLLSSSRGGKGRALTPIRDIPAGHVTIFGAGNVGRKSIEVATGLGARVTVVDVSESVIAAVDAQYGSRIETFLRPHESTIRRIVADTDLLVGAVLVPGKRAPIVVPHDIVALMGAGSAIVDVAVDEGGCIGRTEMNSHPTERFVSLQPGRDGPVLLYRRPNMPAEWGQTSSIALAQSFWPYLARIIRSGIGVAAHQSDALRKGLVLREGVSMVG